jgi:hypothetical protein
MAVTMLEVWLFQSSVRFVELVEIARAGPFRRIIKPAQELPSIGFSDRPFGIASPRVRLRLGLLEHERRRFLLSIWGIFVFTEKPLDHEPHTRMDAFADLPVHRHAGAELFGYLDRS